MKLKKGQAWGFDLIIAVTIFLAGMIFFFFYVLNFPSERDEVFNTMNYEGKIIGDSLLSEGYPENWGEDNVATIGILSNGKINETKLLRFYDLSNGDYAKTKRLFNVLDDYYVYFEEPVVVDGVVINGTGMKEASPKNLVKVTRVVVHDNKIKNLNIHIWN